MDPKCPNCDCRETKDLLFNGKRDRIWKCISCDSVFSKNQSGETLLLKKGIPKTTIEVNRILEDLR